MTNVLAFGLRDLAARGVPAETDVNDLHRGAMTRQRSI